MLNRKSLEKGQKSGVSGVPTFFINGEKLVGAQPFSAFQQVIDLQLGKTIPSCPAGCTCTGDEIECPETKKCPAGCTCTGDEIECPAEEKRIECTSDSDCGELINCPDGSTYQKHVCEDNKCGVVNYVQDPCEASLYDAAVCTTGCNIDGKCIPYGQRLQNKEKENVYCGLLEDLENQKQDGASCQNNYECFSNQCSNGQCTDLAKKLEETTSLLEKILDFFRRLFGG